MLRDWATTVFLDGFFLHLNRAVLDCSDVSEQFKLKFQKPVRVPPRSVSCLCVKTNCILSPDSSYVLTGQRSEDIEITDSLIKPYTARQIPITIRNRSDRFITLRRRDFVAYLQPLDGAGVAEPELLQLQMAPVSRGRRSMARLIMR